MIRCVGVDMGIAARCTLSEPPQRTDMDAARHGQVCDGSTRGELGMPPFEQVSPLTDRRRPASGSRHNQVERV